MSKPNHSWRLASLLVLSLLANPSVGWAEQTIVPYLPNPATTPGVTNQDVTQDNIHQTICVPGWTKTIRPPASYTTKLKIQQMKALGLVSSDPSAFEEDHLISLEIGGHPTDSRNLWPQPWSGAWGAHKKDRLENRLKTLVCTGKLTLIEAQTKIKVNWVDAYETFVGEP